MLTVSPVNPAKAARPAYAHVSVKPDPLQSPNANTPTPRRETETEPTGFFRVGMRRRGCAAPHRVYAGSGGACERATLVGVRSRTSTRYDDRALPAAPEMPGARLPCTLQINARASSIRNGSVQHAYSVFWVSVDQWMAPPSWPMGRMRHTYLSIRWAARLRS